jgi:hypothetical protein
MPSLDIAKRSQFQEPKVGLCPLENAMADPSLFDALRIPSTALVALDNRALHFAMQPYHHLVRLVHVLAMGAFFGGIGLLDVRLMGVQTGLPIRAFAGHVLPWLYVTFGVAVVTGVALFAYDPLHVGSHAYFAPKQVLIALGLANVALFHWAGYLRIITEQTTLPLAARAAGAVSLVIWTSVIVCSSLNVEGVPKVLLR